LLLPNDYSKALLRKKEEDRAKIILLCTNTNSQIAIDASAIAAGELQS